MPCQPVVTGKSEVIEVPAPATGLGAPQMVKGAAKGADGSRTAVVEEGAAPDLVAGPPQRLPAAAALQRAMDGGVTGR